MLEPGRSDAFDVLADIKASNSSIVAFKMRWIENEGKEKPPSSKDDYELKKYQAEALELRREYKIPFWMALNFVLERYDIPLPPAMIAATAYHAPTQTDAIFEVRANELRFQQLRDNHEEGRMLTVLSDVQQGGECDEPMHLPMLDFRATPTARHESNIVEILRQLGVSGYLLESGNSYHFYSQQLLGTSALLSFLARASLFIPIVDQRWTAHQIIERRCALRVSPRGSKSFPTYVCRVN